MALNFDHKVQTARHVYGVADAHTSTAHSLTAATHHLFLGVYVSRCIASLLGWALLIRVHSYVIPVMISPASGWTRKRCCAQSLLVPVVAVTAMHASEHIRAHDSMRTRRMKSLFVHASGSLLGPRIQYRNGATRRRRTQTDSSPWCSSSCTLWLTIATGKRTPHVK